MISNSDTSAVSLNATACTFVPQGTRTCNVSFSTLQRNDYGSETVQVSGSASGDVASTAAAPARRP